MIKVNVTKFRYSHADANPEWLVIEKRGRGTWIAEIIDCPDYKGTQSAFTTQQIESSISWSNNINRSMDESAKFYANLQVGSIVHYSNGHNAYVRCQVTEGHQLLYIALVGDWAVYDLPRRMQNGEIYNGYHADNIKNKKVFQPHASNVYEFNVGRRPSAQPIGFNRWVNPINLPAINLTVPPMTPEEKTLADKHHKLERITTIARNHEMTPQERLDMISNIMDDNAI